LEEAEEEHVSAVERKAQMQNQENDYAGFEGKDKFKSYGPSIISYFKLHERLLCCFFILSLFSMPMIYIYYNQGGLYATH
jgi:hypothetical protein